MIKVALDVLHHSCEKSWEVMIVDELFVEERGDISSCTHLLCCSGILKELLVSFVFVEILVGTIDDLHVVIAGDSNERHFQETVTMNRDHVSVEETSDIDIILLLGRGQVTKLRTRNLIVKDISTHLRLSLPKIGTERGDVFLGAGPSN